MKMMGLDGPQQGVCQVVWVAEEEPLSSFPWGSSSISV